MRERVIDGQVRQDARPYRRKNRQHRYTNHDFGEYAAEHSGRERSEEQEVLP